MVLLKNSILVWEHSNATSGEPSFIRRPALLVLYESCIMRYRRKQILCTGPAESNLSDNFSVCQQTTQFNVTYSNECACQKQQACHGW